MFICLLVRKKDHGQSRGVRGVRIDHGIIETEETYPGNGRCAKGVSRLNATH